MDYQIIWRGRVHDYTGFARATRGMILALDKIGVDVKIEPENYGAISAEVNKEHAKRIQELIDKPYSDTKKKVLIYYLPHGLNIKKERESYDYIFAYPYWETTLVPRNWFPNLNLVDAILAPSTQNKEAYLNSGVKPPVFTVIHGADIDDFTPNNKPLALEIEDDRFKFLSIFHWQHRKAPEVLLEAYWKEFTSDDKTSLIIKTHIGNPSKNASRHIVNTVSSLKQRLGIRNDKSPQLLMTTTILTDEQIKGLYTFADIFVLPSRGEGVGMPYIEAMSSGIPSIATGWGGQTDFIDNANGYLIDYELEPTTTKMDKAISYEFRELFTSKMLWAEPSVDNLRKIMRHAYNNQDIVKQKGKQAREDMEAMTWNNSAVNIKEIVGKVINNASNNS